MQEPTKTLAVHDRPAVLLVLASFLVWAGWSVWEYAVSPPPLLSAIPMLSCR